MNTVILIISLLASLIGAICGIGGGVIIKPVMDALTDLPAASVNFLSSCTVLSMTTYSVIKAKISGKSLAAKGIGIALALGAAAGGIIGKILFDNIKMAVPSPQQITSVQSVVLLIITFVTLLYTLKKDKIKTHQIINVPLSTLIGLLLGIMSSFLGIGGGPINLVVLHYFFSMDTKESVGNSLFIIFMSQSFNLVYTTISRTIPQFSIALLSGMILCGILGGIAGRKINKQINPSTVNKLFICLIILIMFICFYNIVL